MHGNRVSNFERVFDVVIWGAGYAGYAAARSLQAAGHSVLLADLRGDMLWESGRSFALESGSSARKEWADFLELLRKHQACTDRSIDGALAEILATHQLTLSEVEMLYYVCPVAVEKVDGNIVSMMVATKSGPRRIRGRQWIDASESGLLARLSCPDAAARTADAYTISIYLERNDWPAVSAAFSMSGGEGMSLSLQPTVWDIGRCLQVTVAGDEAKARAAYLPALQRAHEQAPDLFSGALVTHWSVEPYPHYSAGAARDVSHWPMNLAIATPAFTSCAINTLADRFELGLRAAETLSTAPHSEPPPLSPESSYPAVEPCATRAADVVVAGVGTGGALAALAAARQEASVVCFDLLAFAGGIGSGGGIHVYYYGVPGGLQNELDDRVRAVQKYFGAKGQVIGFHPDSKKWVLESLLSEADITFLRGAMIYDVTKQDGRVVSMLVATSNGPVRLEAHAWVDGTGDGDLAVCAGAAYQQGRAFDGLTHAYSQSSGQVEDNAKGQRHVVLVNYDAGWCDASDSEDLTRARLWGICQYWRSVYTAKSRPTYIAPALGLREWRQIECDVMLSLGDFIERRHFEDCVAFAAGHYDSHIRDFEFESDEALFWVWFTRSGLSKSACEIPYRMLLPKELSNVWIASRSAGRTHDGQFPFRMQRDMQRIGEVAGTAAALAAREQLDSRHVPLEQLRQCLRETEAISVEVASRSSSFRWEEDDVFVHEYHVGAGAIALEAGLKSLAQGEATAQLWHLYRAGDEIKPLLLKCLSSVEPAVSWLAAGVLAMRGDEVAEPRLLAALASLEDGFPVEDQIGTNGRGRRPETNHWYQFNWVVAISLLRICGTSRSIDALGQLAVQSQLPFNIRTAIAVTLERLIRRGMVTDVQFVERILRQLLAGQMPGRYSGPQRQLSRIYRAWMRQKQGVVANDSDLELTPAHLEGTVAEIVGNREDHLWQLQLAVAAARRSAGLPPQPELSDFRNDERAFVRHAVARLLD